MATSKRGLDDKDVEEWILSIIDQLRQRKARPDLERICHFVERKHGLSRKETELRLETLVDSGAVIKVMYKRGTSYRNARHSKAKKRTYVSNVLNSSIASERINQAITSLLNARRNRTETESSSNETKVCDGTEKFTEGDGISSSDIELWVSANFGEGLGPYPIHWMLQREVDAGKLRVLENGNFLPREPDEGDEGSPSNGACGSDRPVLQKSMSVVAKRGRPPKRKVGIYKIYVNRVNACTVSKCE